MNIKDQAKFISGLKEALRKERASRRIYYALAQRESNEARRKALIGLAETEAGHATRWSARLKELGNQNLVRMFPPIATHYAIGFGAGC
ncbi:MAG: hypothetical protein M1282_05245 [Chloroflexi bacterium]|nr:hypothetical protein [Chloroflexota bacterium]